MPRRARSAYSRRTCRASGERSIESFRSQKRMASSCSSDRRAQRRARARAAMLDQRVGDIAADDEASRETDLRAYPSARALSAVRGANLVPGIACRSVAEIQQRMREQPIRGAFDQLLLDQAVAPRSWDGACGVVRPRERAACRCHYVAVPAEVRGDE